MRLEKLLERARNNPANVNFADACRIAEAHGFRLSRQKGSHHIYTKTGVRALLNLQEVKGKAKPYQVRQLLQLIDAS